MLLFQGPRDQLLQPLQAVSGIVDKRQTMAILSNVLLEVDAGQLILLATDVEIQIRTTTVTSCTQPASLTVSARKLQDILRSLPETTEVRLELENPRLQVRAGRSRFHLQTLPAENFPRMDEPSGVPTELTLTQGLFRRLLGLVQYAMAQQDIRYYLNGLLLVIDGHEMRVVATDGHRLAFASAALSADAALPRIEVILPRKTVIELYRQLADDHSALRVRVLPTQAMFRFGNVELITKLIDGKFPDYERVIPKQNDKVLELESAPLLQSLQRVAILITDKMRCVRLVVTPGSLKIIASNAEQEEALEEIETDYDGEVLDIGFNVGYLLDVLHNVPGERIRLLFADANSSALIRQPDSERFLYVVMPMRI